MTDIETNGLTAEQTDRLRERLIAERGRLTERLATRRGALARAATREPDDADWASSSADQSLIARLTDRDSKLLAEVDRALGKLTGGGYGLCELTGEPIGFDRLWARPWARHALASKETIERARWKGRGGEVVPGAEEERGEAEEVA
jgi:DnaK suppressor protein